MSHYQRILCLGLSVLLLGAWEVSAQEAIGGEGIREYDPVVNADGDVVYFTRPDYAWNQGTDNRADVWIRHRSADGQWQSAINPGSPINSFDHDRILGVTVDGNRLAVLRIGSASRIDLLARRGRNWRIVDGWPLPEDAGDTDNLTFNPNSLTLVYARRGIADASADLYRRDAGPRKSWSEPIPLVRLNSPNEDESAPRFGGDGRTLFFRRSGRWFRQQDRERPAEVTELSARYLQVTAAADLVVGTTDEVGRDERLVTFVQSVLPSARVRYASLGESPAGGELTVAVPLSSGVTLRVAPDPLDRYAIMLRPGEVDFPESAVPEYDPGRPAGSLASVKTRPDTDRGTYLRETLAARERQLAELDRLRQLGYTRPLGDTKSEPEAPLDTVPPATAAEEGSTRARYARDLNELERMKEKFRRQQEARLRREDRGGTIRFQETSSPVAGRATAPAVDSALLRASVQTGLYPPPQPSLTERQSWEHRVSNDLPRTGSLTAEEAAALDAEYARQMQEIEALRTQLREVERMTEKSGVPEAAAPGGITFVPNTAYLNTAGFDALDTLAEEIRRAPAVIELRVHTDPALDARAAQKLSEERAATITERLLAVGVHAQAFRAVGYGNHVRELGETVEVVR